MAKPIISVQSTVNSALLPPYPLIDRSTVANLPSPLTERYGALALVTDGTFGVNAGQGSAPVGGGLLLNLVWNNGNQWITV